MRSTGNAPVFQVPRRGWPSARVWVTVLLCAALPPFGLIVLWRGLRCPVRGKMLLSLVALISMTAMLTGYIGSRRNLGTVVPLAGAASYAVNEYAPAKGASVAAATPTPAPAPPQMTPVPANPVG